MRGLTTESHAMVNEAVDLLEQAAALGDQSSMGDRVQWLLAAALTSRARLSKADAGFSLRQRTIIGGRSRSRESFCQVLTISPRRSYRWAPHSTSLDVWLVQTQIVVRRQQCCLIARIQILDSLAKESTNFPDYCVVLVASFAGRATVHDAARMAEQC